MSDLVVTEDVGHVPGAVADVGDSLVGADASQYSADSLTPSLLAVLWVSNEVLPAFNAATSDQMNRVGDATDRTHRVLVGTDDTGVGYV